MAFIRIWTFCKSFGSMLSSKHDVICVARQYAARI